MGYGVGACEVFDDFPEAHALLPLWTSSSTIDSKHQTSRGRERSSSELGA